MKCFITKLPHLPNLNLLVIFVILLFQSFTGISFSQELLSVTFQIILLLKRGISYILLSLSLILFSEMLTFMNSFSLFLNPPALLLLYQLFFFLSLFLTSLITLLLLWCLLKLLHLLPPHLFFLLLLLLITLPQNSLVLHLLFVLLLPFLLLLLLPLGNLLDLIILLPISRIIFVLLLYPLLDPILLFYVDSSS